jgi:hypothetical protein
VVRVEPERAGSPDGRTVGRAVLPGGAGSGDHTVVVTLGP